ncbi:hypothetical protein Tco_0134039 [Tanacetum coccineum]
MKHANPLVESCITYKKNEVLFSEEIGVLKRDVACKDSEINVRKSGFEKVKQEKDGIDFKIEKFDKASKDLDQLLGSQISDKCKKGLGYSAFPLPHPLIYNRPNKLDLSYSGLDEFKEPEFKGYGPKDSEQESNVVCDKKSDNSKENYEESLVEEQVSQDTNSFVESSPKVDKETVFPVNKKVEFTKPKNNEKPVKKSVRASHNMMIKDLLTVASSGPLDRKHSTMSTNSVGTSEENSQDCIVMPIWKDTLYFDSPTKDVENERFSDDNSTKDVNAARQHVNTASLDVTTGSLKFNVVGPSVNTASTNEQESTEEEPEVDLGNITNSYIVLITPNTRIHKRSHLTYVIGEMQSMLTRRLTKPTLNRVLSDVYEQKIHDTLNTCLYACFLSHIEPISIAKALSDSSWVEAMQEELLQFKL